MKKNPRFFYSGAKGAGPADHAAAMVDAAQAARKVMQQQMQERMAAAVKREQGARALLACLAILAHRAGGAIEIDGYDEFAKNNFRLSLKREGTRATVRVEEMAEGEGVEGSRVQGFEGKREERERTEVGGQRAEEP